MNLRSIISTFLLSSPWSRRSVVSVVWCVRFTCDVLSIVRSAFMTLTDTLFMTFRWNFYCIHIYFSIHIFTNSDAVVKRKKCPQLLNHCKFYLVGKYLLVAAIRVDLSQSSRFVRRFCDTIRMSSAKILPQCLSIKQVPDTKQGYRRRSKKKMPINSFETE